MRDKGAGRLMGLNPIVMAACCAGLLALAAPSAGSAAAAEEDLAFAEALVDLGFPDYADKLLARLPKDDPGLQERAALLRIKILVGYRKFAEAEALVKAIPAGDARAQAAWMAIANGYIQARDLERAKQIYADFLARNANAFDRGDGTNSPVVLEAAYRMAQIMENSGDIPGAIQAYDRLLRLVRNDSGPLLGKLQCAQAALYLKKAQAATDPKAQALALESAAQLCRTVIWRGVDFYFCQAMILLAHIDLARGDREAARKKITDNKTVFQKIDEYLRKQKDDEEKLPLSLSPMAGGLFFLGRLDQEQGEALLKQSPEQGIERLTLAFKELNAVAAGYPESEWAPEAAARAQAVRDRLLAAGKTVEPVATAARAAPAAGAPAPADAAWAARLKAADALFYSQTNYAQAQAAYQELLRDGPDTTNTPRALMNLARCHAHQQDALMLRATAGYLGERFARDPQAGICLLQVGKTCAELQQRDLLGEVYAVFLENHPRHDSAPAVLFSLAVIRKRQGDAAAAEVCLDRLIAGFPNDPYYLKALDQAAWWRYQDRKYEEAAALFRKFIAENRDPGLAAQARFGLGNCLMSLERYPEALAEFRAAKAGLESRAAARDAAQPAAQLKKQADMLEQTLYLMAFCLSRLDRPAASVPGYRDEALVLAGQFLKSHSNSVWAPKVMSLEGALQIERGQVNLAADTFNRLAARYPDSPEGRNALVSLVQAALNIRKYEVAREAFQKMAAQKEYYLRDGRETVFAYLGRALFDAGQYPEAASAYRLVTGSATTNKALLENALFYLGRSACESTNYAEAVAVLNDLLARYPQSGYYYDAKFLLGRAHRGLGQYREVYTTLNDVATRSTNIVLLNKASLELSKTQLSQGLKKEALASLLRVTLLADASHPELRPLVEEALLKSLELQREIGTRDDVIETCRQYLAKFPDGSASAEVKRILREAELQLP